MVVGGILGGVFLEGGTRTGTAWKLSSKKVTRANNSLIAKPFEGYPYEYIYL